MYRITLYHNNEKTIDEMSDEDEMRGAVEKCLNDLEAREISSFTVSWISKHHYDIPFWEK